MYSPFSSFLLNFEISNLKLKSRKIKTKVHKIKISKKFKTQKRTYTDKNTDTDTDEDADTFEDTDKDTDLKQNVRASMWCKTTGPQRSKGKCSVIEFVAAVYPPASRLDA